MRTDRWLVLGAAAALVVVAFHSAVAAPQAQGGLPAEMLGATWELSALQTAPESVDNTVGSGITIAFNADGTANGSGGCNNYNGSYTAGANNALSFGPLASTRKGCEQAVNDREVAYFAALDNVATYALDGANRLVLQSADASAKLEYVRASATQLPATGAGSSSLPLLALAAGLAAIGGAALRVGSRWKVKGGRLQVVRRYS